MQFNINKIIDSFWAERNNYIIMIIANVNSTVQNNEPYINHANPSEFFTKEEFSSISSAITQLFGYVRIFYSETEFIHYVLDNVESTVSDKILVYNFTRDGLCEGKKSLIPAFCDLYNLRYISSNAFVLSLLRNKYIYTKYLESLEFSVPFTFLKSSINENNFTELKDKTYILKNIFESASIGMESSNILYAHQYNSFRIRSDEISKKMNAKDLLIQEYIPGTECEVFVVRYKGSFHSFSPIMLSLNNSDIITSQLSNAYDYTFLPLSAKYTETVCSSIQRESEKAARCLNIKNYARFDYRVDSQGHFYLIDIAGSPYLIEHSSIAYLFKNILKLKYSDIFLLISALTLENYSYDVNCRSDKGNPLDE